MVTLGSDAVQLGLRPGGAGGELIRQRDRARLIARFGCGQAGLRGFFGAGSGLRHGLGRLYLIERLHGGEEHRLYHAIFRGLQSLQQLLGVFQIGGAGTEVVQQIAQAQAYAALIGAGSGHRIVAAQTGGRCDSGEVGRAQHADLRLLRQAIGPADAGLRVVAQCAIHHVQQRQRAGGQFIRAGVLLCVTARFIGQRGTCGQDAQRPGQYDGFHRASSCNCPSTSCSVRCMRLARLRSWVTIMKLVRSSDCSCASKSNNASAL